MKILDRCISIFAIFCLFCLMPITAFAAENGSVTLICRTDETTLIGMQWDLYKVAVRNPYLDQLEQYFSADNPTVEQPNVYRTIGQFEGSPVMLNDTTPTAMAVAAVTLENEAILRKYQPQATAYAGIDGEVNFENLDEGLYLLSGKRMKIGDKTYIPTAMLVEIMDDSEHNNYRIDAFPKMQLRTLAGEDTLFTVRKVWQNDDYFLEDRSAYIVVNVYKNGELYDTATLNEENNWTKTWYATDDAEWRVEEVEIPAKYTVVYLANETQFVVENTYNPWYDSSSSNEEWQWAVTTTTPETTTMKNSDSGHFTTAETLTSKETGKMTSADSENTTVPKSTSSNFSENSSESQTTTVTTFTATNGFGGGFGGGNSGGFPGGNSLISKLPQTGQLWWPVPFLALDGIIFLMIGWKTRRQEEQE